MEELIEYFSCFLEEHKDNMSIDEVGAMADIIKDLSEAMYHCTVVKAMEKGESIPYVSNTVQKSMV